MTRDPHAPLLLIAPDSQLPSGSRVWGTGGWLPPDEREALDWLTLARASGWGVDLATPDAASIATRASRDRRWVVLGCAVENMSAEAVGLIRSWLADEPLVVVGRAGPRDAPWHELAGVATSGDSVTGRNLRLRGDPTEDWLFRQPFSGQSLGVVDGVTTIADVDGKPVVVARQVGRGCVVTLAFHPGEARDQNGVATTMLRKVLIGASLRAVAWIDHGGALVLRMDDPGAAQSIHLRSWRYRQLDGGQWADIGKHLRARRARLSVGYVAGWVDDGDATLGTLTVGGAEVARRAGTVQPSPQVVYRSYREPAGELHDYAGQYRALRALQAEGAVDVELHGYTHMDPDLASWARAADRYDSVGWYRELGARALPSLARLPLEAHPLALGIVALDRYFGSRPSTLICPGDEWTNEALEVALGLGLRAVSSYYFALRHDDRFCWTQHLCAPYLDEADSRWFDSDLPVVGYFHDRDVALHGADWLDRCLDAWSHAGARQFLTLRELTAASGVRLQMHESADGCELDVRSEHGDAEQVVVPVRVRIPGARALSRVRVRMGTSSPTQPVDVGHDGLFRISLAGLEGRR